MSELVAWLGVLGGGVLVGLAIVVTRWLTKPRGPYYAKSPRHPFDQWK
jgi:hypothetical protein